MTLDSTTTPTTDPTRGSGGRRRSGASMRSLVRVGSAPLAVVAAGLLVWNASHSAFSSQTENPGNAWATGTVSLTDDDNGSAMFNATHLKPGSTGSNCISVTSDATLPSTVKLYGSSYSQTKSLAGSIDLAVEQGTGGSYGDCTGFSGSSVYSGTLAAFAAKTTFAAGVGTWAPTGSGTESRTYKITWTVNASAPTSVAGGTAALAFTWEEQNS